VAIVRVAIEETPLVLLADNITGLQHDQSDVDIRVVMRTHFPTRVTPEAFNLNVPELPLVDSGRGVDRPDEAPKADALPGTRLPP